MAQRTPALTNTCPENVPTGPSDRFPFVYPGDFFGSPIKGCDSPFSINGENPIGNAIKYDFGLVFKRSSHANSFQKGTISAFLAIFPTFFCLNPDDRLGPL
jgi:hypothetical protein